MPATTLEPWALVSLAQVKRQGLGVESKDQTQDEGLRFLINAASDAFMLETGREFRTTVSNPATRTFPVSPIQVYGEAAAYANFGNYDAQTVTGVTVNSQSSSPTVLDATQYQPVPVEQWYGVYTGVQIAGSVVWQASLPGITTTVAVTGTWGWPVVPDYVQRLCVEQVKIWLRSSYQVISQSYDDSSPVSSAGGSGLRLSPAIADALSQYKTVTVFC